MIIQYLQYAFTINKLNCLAAKFLFITVFNSFTFKLKQATRLYLEYDLSLMLSIKALLYSFCKYP